jgi:hypothetical protein
MAASAIITVTSNFRFYVGKGTSRSLPQLMGIGTKTPTITTVKKGQDPVTVAAATKAAHPTKLLFDTQSNTTIKLLNIVTCESIAYITAY